MSSSETLESDLHATRHLLYPSARVLIMVAVFVGMVMCTNIDDFHNLLRTKDSSTS